MATPPDDPEGDALAAEAILDGDVSEPASSAALARPDVVRQLQTVRSIMTAFDAVEAPAPAIPKSTPAPPTQPTGLRMGVVVVALIAGGVAGFLLHRPDPAPSFALRRLSTGPGFHTDPALSPDGKQLVYASDRSGGNLDLWTQDTAGQNARRLTDDPADDSQPSLSPDGATVVFRSERDGGGLYTVAATGGEARLFARNGRWPRFSPDGTLVAFVGVPEPSVFVMPVTGGAARELPLRAERESAPVWSPDGNDILVRGVPRHEGARREWWIASVKADGAPPRSLPAGAYPLGGGEKGQGPIPWQWTADGVLFGGPLADDGATLWRAPLASGTLEIRGAPVRLFLSTDSPSQPQAAPDGRILFRAMSAPRPRVEGTRVRSRDGKRTIDAIVTSDGTALEWAVAGGAPRRLCENCGAPADWSPDGRHALLIYPLADPSTIGVVEVASGRRAEILKDGERALRGARFSPDGRWLVFTEVEQGATAALVARFRALQPVDEKEWKTVARDTAGAALWSSRGDAVYFLADRDGFRCLWSQPIGVETGAPLGEPVVVQHFHERKSAALVGQDGEPVLSIVDGRIVASRENLEAALWWLEPH